MLSKDLMHSKDLMQPALHARGVAWEELHHHSENRHRRLPHVQWGMPSVWQIHGDAV